MPNRPLEWTGRLQLSAFPPKLPARHSGAAFGTTPDFILSAYCWGYRPVSRLVRESLKVRVARLQDVNRDLNKHASADGSESAFAKSEMAFDDLIKRANHLDRESASAKSLRAHCRLLCIPASL